MPNIIKSNILIGSLFAVAATILWSGNFIVARGIAKEIPPFGLAFYRWSTALLIIFPFAIKKFLAEWRMIKQNWLQITSSAVTGIAVFNTCLYIAGHHSTAINIALLGTTTSPVVSILLARTFLKEKISAFGLMGLLLCILGILFLLSKGSIETLLAFRFNEGDRWILLAALSFAIYNVLVKKKSPAISPVSFLFATFLIGLLILFPFYIIEKRIAVPVQWNVHLYAILVYIGLGASVLAFFAWNKAVASLGAARTSLFGYLIPIFSAIEAVWLLHEEISWVHYVCGAFVIAGLVVANVSFGTKEKI